MHNPNETQLLGVFLQCEVEKEQQNAKSSLGKYLYGTITDKPDKLYYIQFVKWVIEKVSNEKLQQ